MLDERDFDELLTVDEIIEGAKARSKTDIPDFDFDEEIGEVDEF